MIYSCGDGTPIWFYALMVPVFFLLGVCVALMALTMWDDFRRSRP